MLGRENTLKLLRTWTLKERNLGLANAPEHRLFKQSRCQKRISTLGIRPHSVPSGGVVLRHGIVELGSKSGLHSGKIALSVWMWMVEVAVNWCLGGMFPVIKP